METQIVAVSCTFLTLASIGQLPRLKPARPMCRRLSGTHMGHEPRNCAFRGSSDGSSSR